jgi:hypothetical protein
MVALSDGYLVTLSSTAGPLQVFTNPRASLPDLTGRLAMAGGDVYNRHVWNQTTDGLATPIGLANPCPYGRRLQCGFTWSHRKVHHTLRPIGVEQRPGTLVWDKNMKTPYFAAALVSL